MSTPYEQAKAVYAKEHNARSFEEDLHWHLLNGYVISRPDFFVMGRHVDSKAPPGLIVNPSWLFHPDTCDCWHVYLFAGDIARAFGIMPWELPLVSFERRNDLRFYPLASIRRLSGVT
jgi:hypothetical protein